MLVLSAEVADVAWAAALGMGTSQRQDSAGKLGPPPPEINVSRQLSSLGDNLGDFCIAGPALHPRWALDGIGQLCSINLLLILSPELCYPELHWSNSAGANTAGSLDLWELVVSVLMIFGDCGKHTLARVTKN